MKDIPKFEGLYAATEDGKIWSYYKNKFLKTTLTKEGYLKVVLVKNKIHYNKLVHRLIAQTFLENPNNLPIINHKDENKINNSINNLEWCDYKYNSNYGTLPEKLSKKMKNFLRTHPDFMKGKNNHKSIPIKCIETNQIFETYTDAAKWCKLKDVTCFIDYFKGKQGSAGKHPETKEKLHWLKFEDNEWREAIKYVNKKRSNDYLKKKIKCIETNEIFNSITEAEKKYNCRHISECCNKKRLTAGGKHWEYV